MALQDIISKIKADAEVSKHQILDAARERADAILRSAKEELETESVGYADVFQRERDSARRTTLSTAASDNKRDIDAHKRRAIDSVFDVALKTIDTLSDNDYERILASLIREIPRGTEGTLVVPSKRRTVSERVLRSAGITGAIKTDDSSIGGVVIRSKTFDYDLRIERILSTRKPDLEIRVAEHLFSAQ